MTKLAPPSLTYTLAATIALALVAACSSSSSNNTNVIVGDNGVDDVSKACQIRAGWAHSTATVCSQCMAEASEPRCPCTDLDFAGACSSQHSAVATQAGCSTATLCASQCAQGDCNCTDACYQGNDACRTAASALDGCLAEVCAPHCQ